MQSLAASACICRIKGVAHGATGRRVRAGGAKKMMDATGFEPAQAEPSPA